MLFHCNSCHKLPSVLCNVQSQGKKHQLQTLSWFPDIYLLVKSLLKDRAAFGNKNVQKLPR